jgi:hypothetical protein
MARAECERDGTFQLRDLQAGAHELRASNVVDTTTPRATLEIEIRSEDLEGLVIDLPAATAVEGTVTTTAGDPLADAVVCARASDDTKCRLHARAAGDGSFHIPLSAGGSFHLAVVGDPDADEQKVAIAEGEVVTGVLLRASPHDESIEGRVVDTSGEGVADAFVTATGEKMGVGRPRDTVMTAHDGSFSLAQLRRGSYTLRASVRGAGEVSMDSVASGTVDVELRIAPTGSAQGRVHGVTRAPPSFTIALEDRAADVLRRDTFVSPTGNWEFTDLPPGSYVAYAMAGQSFASSSPFEVEPGGIGTVDLTLQPFVRVTGTVVDADTDAPIPGIRVWVSLGVEVAAGSIHESDSLTDDGGRFALDVPADRVVALILHPTTKAAGAFRPQRISVTPENGTVGSLRMARRTEGGK